MMNKKGDNMINKKIITSFILGLLLSVGSVFATNILSSETFTYDNSTSKLTSTNIQTAIDELYNNKVTREYFLEKYKAFVGTPTNYNFDATNKPTTSSPTTPPEGKVVYAALYEDGSYGICIRINEAEECFKPNNYIAEKEHLKSLLTESNFYNHFYSDAVSCDIYDTGEIHCEDNNARKVTQYRTEWDYCQVGADYVKCDVTGVEQVLS